MSGKIALVLGGTGLVGYALIKQLLQQKEYKQIRSIGRSSLSISHPKLLEKVVSLKHLAEAKKFFQVDDIYCCLGTTIKKAETKANFRKVDLVYPLQAAQLAKTVKAKQFLIITSLKANDKSPFFYQRVKGEVEKSLQNIQIPSIHIFQPSALLGNRPEFRLGEKIIGVIAKPLSHLMIGSLALYRPIHANTVAKAMISIAVQEIPGYHTYPSHIIEKLGN